MMKKIDIKYIINIRVKVKKKSKTQFICISFNKS